MKRIYLLAAVLMAACVTLASCRKADDPVAPQEQNAKAQGDLPRAEFAFSNEVYTTTATSGSGNFNIDAYVYSQPSGSTRKLYTFSLKCAEVNYASSFTVRIYQDDDLLEPGGPGMTTKPELYLYPKFSGGMVQTTYTGQPLEFDFAMLHQTGAPGGVEARTFKIVFEIRDIYGDMTKVTLNLTGKP